MRNKRWEKLDDTTKCPLASCVACTKYRRALDGPAAISSFGHGARIFMVVKGLVSRSERL